MEEGANKLIALRAPRVRSREGVQYVAAGLNEYVQGGGDMNKLAFTETVAAGGHVRNLSRSLSSLRRWLDDEDVPQVWEAFGCDLWYLLMDQMTPRVAQECFKDHVTKHDICDKCQWWRDASQNE